MARYTDGMAWRGTEVRTSLKRLLLLALALYLFFGAVLTLFQKNLIYAPNNQNFRVCPAFADSEKVVFDGTRMYVLRRDPQKEFVFYHGNGGSACDQAYWKEYLDPLNYSYIIVEYTGYSNDTRSPSKRAILADVEHVAAFIRQMGFTHVTVAGQSFGTAVAIYQSTLGAVDKMLLISPFYSVNTIAKKTYWMYPVDLLSTENLDAAKWMEATRAERVEMIHGSEDPLHPIGESRQLFSLTPIAQKAFVEVVGAHHNDLYDFEEVRSSIRDFLRRD
jgi:pimeloyl-ACP methyl ester carboxylesterase